jgi:hypothetical protein
MRDLWEADRVEEAAAMAPSAGGVTGTVRAITIRMDCLPLAREKLVMTSATSVARRSTGLAIAGPSQRRRQHT